MKRFSLDCYFSSINRFYRRYLILIDWIFLLVTGFIAYHALTHRNDDGENDTGHMLFGAIALLFFMRVLFVDLLDLF